MRRWTTNVRVLSATPTSAVASARRWRLGLKRIGRGPESNGAPAPFQSSRGRRRLELERQAEARLRASRVQAREAPGLEDRRFTSPWGHEVALGEVHDEVVAYHVVDRPERLHVELVRGVDRHAEHRHDAAAAVEGEGRQGEERLPVADLVAEGRGSGRRSQARGRGQIEAADQARAHLLLPRARELGDRPRLAARVVYHVVEEELAG